MFRRATGYLVADGITDKEPGLRRKIDRMKYAGMYVMEWRVLLDNACAAWRIFLEALAGRGSGDPRLRALLGDVG